MEDQKISNLKHLEELTFKCVGGDRQIVRIADDFYIYKQNVFTKKWECLAKYDNGWDAYQNGVKPFLEEIVSFEGLRNKAINSLKLSMKTLTVLYSECTKEDSVLGYAAGIIMGKREIIREIFGFSQEEFDSLEKSIQE